MYFLFSITPLNHRKQKERTRVERNQYVAPWGSHVDTLFYFTFFLFPRANKVI